MLACLALRANTKTRCLADRRVALIAIPECRNGPKAFDLLSAAFRHRGLSAVGKAAGHEIRLRGHENALTGFTKESHNIGDLKPLVFVCHEGGFRAAGI